MTLTIVLYFKILILIKANTCLKSLGAQCLTTFDCANNMDCIDGICGCEYVIYINVKFIKLY
jgi:hypothetical protein